MKTYKVLSIDAWGNEHDGYEWNQWFNAGTIDLDDLDSDDSILWNLYKQDFINSVSGFAIDDDMYNLVLVDKDTRKPLLAIEYGSTI
jgi:hypothetical protein